MCDVRYEDMICAGVGDVRVTCCVHACEEVGWVRNVYQWCVCVCVYLAVGYLSVERRHGYCQ